MMRIDEVYGSSDDRKAAKIFPGNCGNDGPAGGRVSLWNDCRCYRLSVNGVGCGIGILSFNC